MHLSNSHEVPPDSILLHYFQVVRQRKWTVLLCLVLVMIIAIMVNYFSTPVYEAEATIIYEEPKDTMFALDIGQVFVNKSPLVNLIQQLKSRTLAKEVAKALPLEIVQTFDLPDPLPPDFSPEKIISGRLRGSLSVDMVQGSDILKIKVRANNPKAAKVIANTYVEIMIDLNVRKKREEISSVRDFLEKQLIVFQDKLNVAEDSLRLFMEKNKITTLSDASTEILNRLTNTEATFNTAKTERMALEQRQRHIEQKKQELAPSLTVASNSLTQRLQQKLLELELQYSTLQAQGVSGDQAEVLALKQKISQAKQELIQELLKIAQQNELIDPLSQIRNLLQESITIEVDLATYKAKEQALQRILADYETKLQMFPQQELQLARLIRSRDVNNKIYSMLLEKREETRITEAGKIGDVRIIDMAEQPGAPIKPNQRQNLALGFVLGVLMGVGLAFFLESLDTSLKSQEDIEKYLALPVLAAIPTIHSDGTNGTLSFKHKNSIKSYSEKLLSRLEWNPLVYEAFRTFQFNFAFVNADRLLKSILLTSAGAGEGKTLTALNLTQVFGRNGVKTLLVDCDLRRPMVHKALGMKSEPGLTNILINKVEPEEAVRRLENHQAYVLPCGTLPPNPSEILDSQKMRDLLARFKKEYDLIILDSPPLIAITDSLVLSNEVDGVCLVIKSGRTHRDMAMKAKRLLESARARIIGTILNDVNLKKVYGYYQDYYSYYTKHQKNPKRSGVVEKIPDHKKSMV